MIVDNERWLAAARSAGRMPSRCEIRHSVSPWRTTYTWPASAAPAGQSIASRKMSPAKPRHIGVALPLPVSGLSGECAGAHHATPVELFTCAVDSIGLP